MAEFGENIRRAREEMGITQQTLADKLYVTRQAVSRWENGSRYPDLLTAKRLAASLDTNLDELLADDDMRTYPEVNPVIEYPLTKRVQTAIFAAAFAVNLIQTLWFIFYNITEFRGYLTSQESALYLVYSAFHVIVTVVLLYGMIQSIKDAITPRVAARIVICITGMEIPYLIAYYFLSSRGILAFIIVILIDILFIISVWLHFCRQKWQNVPMYISIGVIIVTLFSYITGLIAVIGTADLRKYLTNNTLSVFAVLMIQFLFIYMTAVLYRKRRLAKS
ncbi:MAG: helix-turn-helix transcriptional regulator [Ruminococcus sp.]|nr:helix-turn-helix transcriptional regulator [Ruminococcus sp.]